MGDESFAAEASLRDAFHLEGALRCVRVCGPGEVPRATRRSLDAGAVVGGSSLAMGSAGNTSIRYTVVDRRIDPGLP